MFMEDSPSIPSLMSADEFERETERELKGPFKSKFRAGFIGEFTKKRKRREWLVRGALAARSLVLIVGEPGCGKSFLGLDMAMTMALAAVDPKYPQTWFGMEIKPCGICIIAAEGDEDYIFRIDAWKAEHGVSDVEMPVYLFPCAVDMRTSDVSTNDLIAEIKDRAEVCKERFGVGFEAIIIDTLNRSIAGGDDSKPEVVGPFLANCFKIKIELEFAVLPVHHLPKGGSSQDPRGHSSLKGDNDGQWFVRGENNGAPNFWKITRLKVGPTGAKHEFRLRQVNVGEADEKGKFDTSCVVMALASEASPEEADMRAAADAISQRRPTMTADGRMIMAEKPTAVLRALQEASQADGDPFPSGKDEGGNERPIHIPHGRKAIKMARWTDELVKIWPGEDKDSAKFKDARRKDRDTYGLKLAERGYIVIDGDWVWRTARRVHGVDKPERVETPPPEPEFPSRDDAPPF
jgi:hypothetical protein